MSAAPLVLYVDDEPANRLVFERSFGTEFRVEVAASGEEALERVALETPAVVVADQRMPGMAGTELLAALRERSPDSVRVILTAYADPGPMLEAINRAGASRYIVKPWSHAEMHAVLQGAISAFVLQRELRAMQLRLFEAQRFGALGVVAASVAHDMSSPLSALVSNMERLGVHAGAVRELVSSCGESAPPSARDAAEELPDIARESQESTGYLSTLVQSMRGQARARSDEPADPVRVMAYVVPLVRGAVQERGAQLEIDRDDEVPHVQLGSTELCQVLVNLVTNAAHALARPAPVRQITVRVKRREQGVQFSVEDTGKGMTPEQVARAGRERFTTKPEGQGTGLGLTIVRELIERVGGNFEVRSAVGEGTQVRFWLPCAGAEPTQPA